MKNILFMFPLSIFILLIYSFNIEAAAAGAGVRMQANEEAAMAAPSITPTDDHLSGIFYSQAVKFQAAEQYEVAEEAYKSAAKLGNLSAMHALGKLFCEGVREKVAKKPAVGIGYYTEAADKGHVRSLYDLGLVYANGIDNNFKNPSKAYYYLKKAAERDHRYAQYLVAGMLSKGNGTLLNQVEAIKFYKESLKPPISTTLLGLSSEERMQAQYTLGYLYYIRGLHDAAVVHLAKATEANYTPAAFALGLLYYKGRDYGNAWEIFEAIYARDNLHAFANFYIGRMCETGINGSRDEAVALGHYNKAVQMFDNNLNSSTLLHAIQEGSLMALSTIFEGIVRKLVSSGTPQAEAEKRLTNATTKEGLTLMQIAVKYGHTEIQEYLESKAGGRSTENMMDLEAKVSRLEQLIKTLSERTVEDEERRKAQDRELEELKQELQKAKADQSEIATILSDSDLRNFYQHFRRKLAQFFLAYWMLDTGYFVREADTVDRFAKAISLAGDVIPLPGAKLVTGIISFGINVYHHRSESRKISQISSLFVDAMEMAKEIEKAGRVLTSIYEEQIKRLTPESVITLAECAVRRVIEYARAEKFVDDERLTEQVVKAIATFSIPGILDIHGTPLGKNKKLTLKIPTPYPWTDENIFQNTGIYVQEGEIITKWLSLGEKPISSLEATASTTTKGPKVQRSNVRLYGYRVSTREIAELLGFLPAPNFDTMKIQIVHDGVLRDIADEASVYPYMDIERLTHIIHTEAVKKGDINLTLDDLTDEVEDGGPGLASLSGGAGAGAGARMVEAAGGAGAGAGAGMSASNVASIGSSRILASLRPQVLRSFSLVVNSDAAKVNILSPGSVSSPLGVMVSPRNATATLPFASPTAVDPARLVPTPVPGARSSATPAGPVTPSHIGIASSDEGGGSVPTSVGARIPPVVRVNPGDPQCCLIQ